MSSTQVGHWWLIVISNRYQIWYHTHIWHWSNFHWASKSHNAKSFAQYMLEVSHPNSGQCLVSKRRIIFRSKKLWLLFALKFDGEEKKQLPTFTLCLCARRSWSQSQSSNAGCAFGLWDQHVFASKNDGNPGWTEAYTQVLSENPVLEPEFPPETPRDENLKNCDFTSLRIELGSRNGFAAFLGEGLFQNIGRGRRGQGLQVVYQWPTEPNITSVPSLG